MPGSLHVQRSRVLPRTALLILLAILSFSLAAIEQWHLSFGDLKAQGWRLGEVQMHLDWADADRPVLHINIDFAEAGAYRFENIAFKCLEFSLPAGAVECGRGSLAFNSARLSAKAVPVSMRYQFASRQLDFKLTQLALAGGQSELVLRYLPAGWNLEARLADVVAAEFAPLLADFVPRVTALKYQGKFDATLELSGDIDGSMRADWRLQTHAAGYSNSSGDQAAEALGLVSHGSAKQQTGGAWVVKAAARVEQGMLFSDPVYLEFNPQQFLSLATELSWRGDSSELWVESLRFEQPQVMDGHLGARLQFGDKTVLQDLQVTIEKGQLPGLYTNWLQPWLIGGALGDLDTRGALRAQAHFVGAQPQSIAVEFDRVSLVERGGQFGIEELHGPVRWEDSETPQAASLAWRSVNLYRLQFGAAEVALDIGARQVKLSSPLSVPLFDGELRVDEFAMIADQGRMNWLLDGMLTPVSMQTLSQALDWPPFSGKLSGMFPKVRYHKGELTLGGVLLVQAFEGDITLRNLRIQEPLGLVPRLWLDARLERLNLKPLTEAFAFGRIEGRLQGSVDGLYMEAWQPVAFDAEFRTPPDDRSRRRISQRAVDTISDLGGAGVAGALSRGFLRFLEDFPYKALGISCRLENGVCEMGGVAEAANGYYLVQGTLLPPRLDVVGYATEVDWSSLVGRLQAATRGDSPTLE